MERRSHDGHDKNETSSEPTDRDFPIVGLGASAGGIKALQVFFDNMPGDSGSAFVVVMHLSSDFESTLAQVLQQRTSMPVLQVNESVQVVPNHVYVIPPNKHLLVDNGMLRLVEPQQPAGRRVAIDLFFRTLAAAYAHRAVCIVLSGTDSDGAIGIKHVKEQGGITIAQDPTEAEFDGMPRAAIGTGMVDWVLPVAEMSSHLVRFLHNEKRIHIPPEDGPGSEMKTDTAEEEETDGAMAVAQVPGATDEEALVEVLRFLWGQTGHDFAHYKRATILRRIARRLQVNLLEDVASYLVFLHTHPDEVNALLHDLLISVTNFFRDHDAWAALENHIPQLFAGKQAGDQVRVWVAGCASGEEAYSIAMLLSEHAARLETPPSIQVVATDIDEYVIQIARTGVYPTTIEVDVSQERLRRFFQQDHGRYRVKKELRELVLFAAHNVLKDPHFSRMDLITCRNLLIYLKRETQESIFRLFHFALRPGGLLFLGEAESAEEAHALFAPLDKHARLYVRRTTLRQNWQIPVLPLPSALSPTPVLPAVHRPPTNVSIAPMGPTPSSPVTSPPSEERRTPLFGDLHLALLDKFVPPSVIINADYDIVHLTERARNYLQFAGGEPSLNLLKMVPPALSLELRTALFRAIKTESDVTVSHVPVELNGVPRQVDIHVRPARTRDAAEGFTLVVFEPVTETVDSPATVSTTPEPLVRLLEAENQHLKEQLSATIAQYETSIEELKASNEESQAINEEMHSASEELEASKEELQSINEELITVNQELKNNIAELSRANSDLQNLMASTEIGTIFLDRQLCVMRFTPSVQELFNLIPTDLGRPLSDITHKLNYAELTADAERVLQDLGTREREIQSEGQWFLARMLPYRTLDDHIDGVILTFIDITARKHAEEVRIALEREVAVLAERNRLAQELHDSLSQGFTAIKLQMDAAETSLPDDLSAVQRHLVRARELALQSLTDARRSVHGLHSLLFEQGSLTSVFERLAQRTSNGIKVRFLTTGTSYSLPAEVESSLYRIAQEALTNALRHALPQQIIIELHYLPTQVRLRIYDDGQGFDTRVRTKGIGIIGMHERAAQIGGDLSVASQPGQGTEIVLTLETSFRKG